MTMLKLVNLFILAYLVIASLLDNISVKSLETNTLSRASLSTLKYVAVVSRHGSRTPLTTYINDPYPYNNKLFWPSGPDELTSYGKKQLYEVGKQLKERYGGFLPELYFPNDTVAEYNNYNRDFMSAACILAALYPPKGEDVWNKQLLWQPIPLYLRKFDVCDLAYGNICPLYKAESKKLVDDLNNDIIKNNGINKLLRDVSIYTGENITTVNDLYNVYDVLNMQEENGFKLPSWTKNLFPEPIRSIATPVLLKKYGGSNQLIKLGGGPELKRIYNLLLSKVNGIFDENRKFYVEAAHDCTLIALLKAMGNKNSELEVKTSAYLVFELHYLPNMYIIQVFYFRNSSDNDPELINISGCPNPCSLDNFSDFVNRLNPPNWNEACDLNKGQF